MLRGQLLDLVARADRIVIAQISTAERRPAGDTWLSARVVANLRGAPRPRTLRVLSPAYLASGRRYVLFLRQRGDVIESLAPPGTVFEALPADQRYYRHTLRQLGAAWQQAEPLRTTATRAALIGALGATPQALRYQAALDLSALTDAGHGPVAAERQRLERLIRRTNDAALKGLLTSVMRRAQSNQTAIAH
jgi:hypothetical protein